MQPPACFLATLWATVASPRKNIAQTSLYWRFAFLLDDWALLDWRAAVAQSGTDCRCRSMATRSWSLFSASGGFRHVSANRATVSFTVSSVSLVGNRALAANRSNWSLVMEENCLE